jgi:hypothetical protein
MHAPRISLLCKTLGASLLPLTLLAAPAVCEVTSGEHLTPVVELYTSEGCSSCPPADQWLSTLKGMPVVAQSFHVGYWDSIGWKDRFASPAFTARQRDIAAANGLSGIYTPQLVRNGRDWVAWRRPGQGLDFKAPARAAISLRRSGGADGFEARVTPAVAGAAWFAYWTVTEHNHSARVLAGENAGEFLKHDFVVRQYAPTGRYTGTQSLKLYAIAAQSAHPRQINLVVTDPQSGEPLQALSLQCF